MSKKKDSGRLEAILKLARNAAKNLEAQAILILAEWPMDWKEVRSVLGDCKLIVAYVSHPHDAAGASHKSNFEAIEELGIHWVPIEDGTQPTPERLSLALIEAVADDYLVRGDAVIALYSGFDADDIDSISLIRLGEHLERLTASDLRKLETQVPLETLKAVVDLALDIGREGREGDPVGTLFVVGDTTRVLKLCRPLGFDPVKGYNKKDRNIRDRRVRESIKEIARLDGAMIVDRDGIMRAAAQFVNAPATGITLSKGLGTRHWAGAAVTQATQSVAIVVSQSSGTVRIFQDGRIVLRIEALRRAMKWQDFEPDVTGPEF